MSIFMFYILAEVEVCISVLASYLFCIISAVLDGVAVLLKGTGVG